MASLRFSYTNLIESSTIQNGTGGGAPALDEVSPWLTANAKNRDRGHVWQGAATVNVDCTFGGSTAVTLFAVLGHRGAPSSAVGVASVEVFTQTGAYTPAGTWTTRGTITLGSGVRDGFLLIASQNVVSVRYAITATTAFTIGRLYAGTLETDLGIVSSPGYSRRWIDPQLENRMGDLSPFITYSGDGHWEYSLPYENAGATLYAALKLMGQKRRTFVLHDGYEGTVYECRIRSPWQHSLNFFVTGSTEDHHSALEMETLG